METFVQFLLDQILEGVGDVALADEIEDHFFDLHFYPRRVEAGIFPEHAHGIQHIADEEGRDNGKLPCGQNIDKADARQIPGIEHDAPAAGPAVAGPLPDDLVQVNRSC